MSVESGQPLRASSNSMKGGNPGYFEMKEVSERLQRTKTTQLVP